MESWSAHQLYRTARDSLGPSTAKDLVLYADVLRQHRLPVVFSLRHLAELADVRYWFLHETVNRMRESSNYRMYRIRKRSGGFRWIHSVSGELLKVQAWINEEILQRIQPHPSSYAFHPSGGILNCAKVHCGCRWLFQFDLKDFFHNVSEIDCHRTFSRFGYRNLLAFELGRLSTTTRMPKWCPRSRIHGFGNEWYFNRATLQWEELDINSHRDMPYVERFGKLGALPQGAPSSPMLANLAAIDLDSKLAELARSHDLVYTRYADDITLSAYDLSVSRSRIRRDVIRIIRKSGFAENESKCRIAGPGSRKLVLGLLVDGEIPRLSRATYKRIDKLLYGVEKFGFQATAEHFDFESAYGFHNHLSGLIAFVKSVDGKRWEEFAQRLTLAKTK